MKCSIKSSSLISSQPSGLLAGSSPGIRQEPNFPFPNEEVTPDSEIPTLVTLTERGAAAPQKSHNIVSPSFRNLLRIYLCFFAFQFISCQMSRKIPLEFLAFLKSSTTRGAFAKVDKRIKRNLHAHINERARNRPGLIIIRSKSLIFTS